MTSVAVLGSGMAGYGAAHQLSKSGIRPVMYEKRSHYGGHTASYSYEEGFIFDEGPHVSFTKDERIQELFAESVDGDYQRISTGVNNYWRGHWIKHPAQRNLYGLPTDLVVDILKDFVEAHYDSERKVETYEDWLLAAFGETFARTFPMEYGLKYHTTEAKNMSIDWLGERLYKPSLEEVFHGALSETTPDVHYIDRFRYPTHGGFISYLSDFLDHADLNVDHEVVKLDPGEKTIHFSNGKVVGYEKVVSSIPLPDLIPMIVGAPNDVLEAAEKLACTQCVLVNVGIDRADTGNAHWSYFYDRDIYFTRLSFPHLLSPNTVPPGAGSIQAEVYFSEKYKPIDVTPEECIEPVIRDLRRCGLIKDDDEILFRNAMFIPYANIIFDLDRAEAVATVHGYLDDVGVAYCGRYGDWGYMWTDESFKSGERAARQVLD